MSRISRSLLTVALVLMMLAARFVVPLASRAHACSCLGLSPQQYLERADMVFIGRVDSIAPAGGDPRQPRMTMTFSIQRVWKGPAVSTVDVVSSPGSVSCGVDFGASTTALIYAQRTADGFMTGICSGTKALVDAAADMEVLGEGYLPSQGSAGAAGDERPNVPAVIGGAVGVLATLAIAAVSLRLRRVRAKGPSDHL
jgi:hypothetical protein